MGPLLILILLFGVMYAVMIRPQQKRARDHQALVAAVQVGDEVMTTAGIFGMVTDVDGDVISIEISPAVVMRVARAAIGRRIGPELEDYEAGETFDDVDDELGTSVADETAPTNGAGATNDPPPPPTTPPETPPIQTPPPATPPASETPPSAPGGPVEQG